MDRIMQAIQDSIRDFLIGVCQTNLESMFTYVNEKAGEIAEVAGQTPQDFNGSIFAMIQNLSNSVMIPIAGIVLTYVLCYELIAMVIERNHGNEMGSFEFFKYFFKMCLAVELVNHTFDITMAIFDVGKYIANKAGGVITGSTSIDASETISRLSAGMQEMPLSDLFVLVLETMIISLFCKILSVIITTIMYGRMIEIYLYTSVAPVPYATLFNREWGTIGSNYIKNICALAMQGFFMTVCVGIYAAMIQSMTISEDMHMSLFSIVSYTLVLAISLYHTGSLSKSICNAH